MPFAIYALFWRDGGRKRFLLVLVSAMCSSSNCNWICSALKQGENPVLPVNFENVSIDCG